MVASGNLKIGINDLKGSVNKAKKQREREKQGKTEATPYPPQTLEFESSSPRTIRCSGGLASAYVDTPYSTKKKQNSTPPVHEFHEGAGPP